MKRPALPSLLWMCCAATGCTEAAPDASWNFRFASGALAARAQIVETEIRQGGCGGPLLFVTQVSKLRGGDSAPPLPAGRYGFRGRARDADCLWFAQGCAEAALPHRGAISVVLDRTLSPSLDPSCVPGEQTTDPLSGDGGARDDAGADSPDPLRPPTGDAAISSPQADASSPGVDAGVVPVDASAPAPDAGTLAFDPSAPKCTDLDASVVACFDFNGSLLDLSSAHNDAVAASARSFEKAVSGRGVRVAAERVALADDPSLNVDAFTVEIWFRPDNLINLAGQAGDVSLLLDKDQQYNVGFNSAGALHMQVYRGIEDAEATTADTPLITVGEFVYAAFSYDGSDSWIYKDGARVDHEVIGLALSSGNGGALHIGSGSPSTTRPFDGLIDALRISNRALSDAEICESAGKSFGASGCE